MSPGCRLVLADTGWSGAKNERGEHPRRCILWITTDPFELMTGRRRDSSLTSGAGAPIPTPDRALREGSKGGIRLPGCVFVNGG